MTQAEIIEVIGAEAYTKLAKHLGGDKIYIGKVLDIHTDIAKDYEFYARFKLSKKARIENLMARYELSRASIYRILKSLNVI